MSDEINEKAQSIFLLLRFFMSIHFRENVLSPFHVNPILLLSPCSFSPFVSPSLAVA